MPNWQDHGEIDDWVKAWTEEVKNKNLDFVGEDDPIDELQHRFERGDFAGPNRKSVAAYLAKAESKRHRVSDEGRADREERAVAAAERSARTAGWALAISIAALALSAWPYIKP